MKLTKRSVLIGILCMVVGIMMGLLIYNWTNYFWLRLGMSIIIIILSIVIIFKNIRNMR